MADAVVKARIDGGTKNATMRALPRPAVAYILIVIAAGAITFSRAVPYVPRDASTLLQLALFALLDVLADLRQLDLGFNANYSVANAVNLACVVIFGPAPAALVSALSSVIADVWKQKAPYKVAFNCAAIGMSVLAGGVALTSLRTSHLGQASPLDLPAMAVYIPINMLVNHSLICIAIGLTTRTHPLEVWWANTRGLLLPIVALFPLGILMAVTYLYFGGAIGILLMTVPTVAVYGALNKAQLLRSHTRAALEALADAVDRRDHYTAEHSQRVATYAERIAVVLGLPLQEREVVVAAARVHDLGKISTPDSVLMKPGSLTEDEWEVMRGHPKVGAEILGRLPTYREHAKLIGFHHERLDGEGYPHRLMGDAIPRGARILAVADAFDAMTSDRPYREGMPASSALSRLRGAAGTQFSPEVVDALAEVLGASATSERRQIPTGAVGEAGA